MTRLVPSIVACAAVYGLAAAAASAQQATAGPVVGRPAPAFTLTTTAGKTVRLSDFHGKTLVVNVWGSWCPPCRLETPDLIAEAKADARGGVAFLGVDTTESASVVRAFTAAKGIPYPQAVTSGTSAFATAYAIRNYPTTFVIGPDGVLRARHADNVLPRAQLHAYIAAAQRGETAPLVTAFQSQLDALLDPAQYAFTGDPATVRANVVKAAGAIAKASDLEDDAMDDPSRDHDLIKTGAEQQTLRDAAIAALAPIASGDADLALLARLRGDAAADRGDWHAADAAYADALTHAPGDVAALGGRADALSELGEKAAVVEIDRQIADRAPSAPAFVGLGRAQGANGDLAGARASFERARALAAGNPIVVAWTNLYDGRTEATNGDRAMARAAFARAASAAEQIPAGNPRRDWYLEQAQEATVALDVARGARASLSLAPWTGADLPGSVESTFKYRLVVTGTPGTTISLAARGLPTRWIGSFCSDRVCAPFRTSVVVPSDGVKVVEFQVVPTTAHAAPVNVRIDAASGGRTLATVATSVRV
ncbi:MAG TPA: redoxin domain-containing protein [Candidatus Elarobacter sp.]|jgi:cytochrome c biogenesis protein CcmG/thiol:disulfide interchange protein DsbE|nr:redoxin domain-containing protein [Candidatus Elarobacter sp.]